MDAVICIAWFAAERENDSWLESFYLSHFIDNQGEKRAGLLES